MSPADKLRELLASRPAMPNTEELVRWWRTSGELVGAFLQERAELVSDLVVADKRNEQQRAELDVLKQEVRELEQQRDQLTAERDRMRPVYEAALRLRAITKRAEQQPTPALLNQQIIDNANAFRELFDAIDAVASGDSSRIPACARLLVGDREEPVTVVGRTADGVVTLKVTDPATIALLKKGTEPISIGYVLGEPATRRTFGAGDVVRLRATDSAPAGPPMTIEDVCSFVPGKGIGVRCVWFDDTDNLHRDVFDPRALEHTTSKEDARG